MAEPLGRSVIDVVLPPNDVLSLIAFSLLSKVWSALPRALKTFFCVV